MKLNSHVTVLGENTILVPYNEHHVMKYHNWMKSEELQKLTASEPLSLAEEYEMQKSWREDEEKCTFIILAKTIYNQGQNEIESMVGDTNIFITDRETMTGEIEIMLAEESARGKKLGWEAVILMLIYGIKYIGIKIFEAKIGSDNIKSIKLFEKLGFCEISRSEIFNEITFRSKVTSEWLEFLEDQYVFLLKPY